VSPSASRRPVLANHRPVVADDIPSLNGNQLHGDTVTLTGAAIGSLATETGWTLIGWPSKKGGLLLFQNQTVTP
jgi:hypothetical protein